MRVYSAAEIRESIDLPTLSRALRSHFQMLSRGAAANSPRLVLPTAGRDAIGAMLAFAPSTGLVGAKVVCVVPGNSERGRNPHQGIVALFDPLTGETRAVLDAAEITALRTVALSLAATECLSRAEGASLSVYGTGLQAYLHALHIPSVRPIRKVTIVGRTVEKAERLVARLRSELDLRIDLVATTEAALGAKADILCLCTASTTPYLRVSELRPGAHVNAIGACRPGMREIEFDPAAGVRLFVDSLSRAREEASEIADAFAEGATPPTEIGIAFGSASGRASAEEITIFKSVGVGLQDLVAASLVAGPSGREGKI